MRTILSKEQKVEIFRKINSGVSIRKLASEYHVSTNTIRRIGRDERILQHFAEQGSEMLKEENQMKLVHENIENRLYAWFLERKVLGDLITDLVLQEKALEISNKFGGSSTFNANKDWLTKFKKRCNIHLICTYGKKTSEDIVAAEKFVINFMKQVEKEGITHHNIYNMDEMGLMWKVVPSKTLIHSNDKSVATQKLKKDCVIVGLCANGSGSHKLDISIHKFHDLKALKNCNSLPVIYKVQERAWVNKEIFNEWYENHFKPSVRRYQMGHGTFGKVILLLDNSQSFELNPLEIQHDENFEIIFLPPNTTALLQPMDQGIAAKLKKAYFHKMLRTVLQYSEDIQEFYMKYNVKDCIRLLHEAWNDMSAISIQNAWKKIMKNNSPEVIEENSDTFLDLELSHIISTITGEEPCQERVNEFLSQCEEVESIYHNEIEEGEFMQEEEEQEQSNISVVEAEEQEGEEEEQEEEEDEEGEQRQKESVDNIKEKELEYALKIIEKYAKNKTTLVIAQSLVHHMLEEYI